MQTINLTQNCINVTEFKLIINHLVVMVSIIRVKFSFQCKKKTTKNKEKIVRINNVQDFHQANKLNNQEISRIINI